LFTGFGLRKEDKGRTLGSFSGGEQTKIQMIRLLLSRPDILLLDEPTNHLDPPTVQWLEEYLRTYPKAVVYVSHDRYFLDQTAEAVCELDAGKCVRYPGNFTEYRMLRAQRLEAARKAYEREQEEIRRLEDLIWRFKNKPRKAAFANSRKKILERMEHLPKPDMQERALRFEPIVPAVTPAKWVVEAEHLKIGYEEDLLELSLRVRRGQKLAVIGDNGTGKSTLLRTIAGRLAKRGGSCSLGNRTEIGWFDQKSAELSGEETVLAHFCRQFPGMNESDARQELARYLFRGRDCAKAVGELSGGEKARLLLCELLKQGPNLLLLDEPTNHMDLAAKEAIEEALRAYQGTMILVSHDRYLVSRTTDQLLILGGGECRYYPFGYDHYRERLRQGKELTALRQTEEQALIAGLQAVPKAERHETRQLTSDEAFGDWQMRLAEEALNRCRRALEEALEEQEGASDWESWRKLGDVIEEKEAELAEACSAWWVVYQESGAHKYSAAKADLPVVEDE
ncbi:MAG: ABC-F family ATP-binding cassette domain-containing protein, partial [Lachnospiraceae bacterium]|nr:ABC-F family ATP-binding cassette domain-containing protein [Lachnospiraceae bacterium]